MIHEYVYNHEILPPKDSREQIDNLIKVGKAKKVNELDVQAAGKLAVKVYEDTIQKLRKEKYTSENGRHWGEIVSIAYAHTMSIPYFLSDESDQQSFIDEHLSSPIQVIRIENFVEAMKQSGGKRKDAKKIWIVSGKSTDRFDNDLWPVSE